MTFIARHYFKIAVDVARRLNRAEREYAVDRGRTLQSGSVEDVFDTPGAANKYPVIRFPGGQFGKALSPSRKRGPSERRRGFVVEALVFFQETAVRRTGSSPCGMAPARSRGNRISPWDRSGGGRSYRGGAPRRGARDPARHCLDADRGAAGRRPRGRCPQTPRPARRARAGARVGRGSGSVQFGAVAVCRLSLPPAMRARPGRERRRALPKPVMTRF